MPLQMNVRSLCVSRVARDVGEPWLWWEYVDKMGEECKMKDRKFDTDCSEKVGGTQLAVGNEVCSRAHELIVAQLGRSRCA